MDSGRFGSGRSADSVEAKVYAAGMANSCKFAVRLLTLLRNGGKSLESAVA